MWVFFLFLFVVAFILILIYCVAFVWIVGCIKKDDKRNFGYCYKFKK